MLKINFLWIDFPNDTDQKSSNYLTKLPTKNYNNHRLVFDQASCCWIYISKGIEHCYRLIILVKVNQHAKNDGYKNHAKKNLWNHSQQISNDLRHAIWYVNKNEFFLCIDFWSQLWLIKMIMNQTICILICQ